MHVHGNFDKIPSVADQPRGAKIAVCVHAFYLDVLAEILPFLGNIEAQYDLFITCSRENEGAIGALLTASQLSAKLLAVDNIGMDVLPFLKIVDKYKLHQYRCLLKLHTKNNFSNLGRIQMKLFLTLLLGSKELVRDIVRAFEERQNMVMVGPNDLYRSAHYMAYNNRSLIWEILQLLERPVRAIDWGFFAGTMFWIRGSALRPLARGYRRLEAFTIEIATGREKTGRDGSVAHALERIWGSLCPVEEREIGLTYRCDAELTRFSMRIDSDRRILEEPLRRFGASDVLERWDRAHQDVHALKVRSDFDEQYYKANVPECVELGIEPQLHFTLYGDLLNIDPLPTFSTAYYQLRRPDVSRKGVNTFSHYSTHGQHEGYSGTPTFNDWVDVAKAYKLFDEKWYGLENGSVALSGLSAEDHYKHLGCRLHLQTSLNFNPKDIPAIAEAICDLSVDSLGYFLANFYLKEKIAYDELTRILQNNDFSIVPGLVGGIFERFGITAAPFSALGLYHIRTANWEDAKKSLDIYWTRTRSRNLPIRHRRSILPSSKIGNEVFDEVVPSEDKTLNITVCVYTALFGDIDELPPILTTTKYCRFVCFTDVPGDVDGWEYRVAKPNMGDLNLDAKWFKVLQDELLQEFDYTMFVDANTLLMGRLDEFITKYLFDNDFVMFRHPERSDVYTEAVAVIESERHSPPKLLKQLQAYHEAGLPNDTGLIEASFIWRARSNPDIRALMEKWWDHITRLSKRDQLSLGFLMWQSQFRPKVVPSNVGTSRDNLYFMKLPHSKFPDAVVARETRRTTSWTKHADIWFLYGSRFINSGSSVLRGDQLSRIVRSAVSDERSVFYTSFDDISEKIVVLTKGYLAQYGMEGVSKLKSRKNIVIADFVDARPEENLLEYVDVLLASSLRGFVYYRRQYPEIRSHHVTHHVDTRISADCVPTGFAAGYFGELINTVRSKEIAEIVDFIPVDTSTSRPTWMQKLRNYSFHYAVRREREIDHFKPFLKGFVAAQCGANVMLQINAGDARFYLGEDYPYLLPANPSPEDLVLALIDARASIGSSRWERALSVMAEVRERSSQRYVTNEVLQLLKTL